MTRLYSGDDHRPLTLDRDAVAASLGRAALIEALEAAFRDGCEAPPRHHHTVAVPGEADATLLLMPAWIPGRYVGTKVAQVFPGNGARGLPAVQSIYLLFCGRTGQLLATLDGGELTTRRTVAASSLAARYMARPDAETLLIVGTGQIAAQIAASHAAVRPIRRVVVWGRDLAKAEALAGRLAADGFETLASDDLRAMVPGADIISCCTLSQEPLIEGKWLTPGTHLDLIGGFTPAMREVDTDAVRRAVVAVDTVAAASEAGDLVIPLQEGLISQHKVYIDLAGLVTGKQPGRHERGDITLFKSVGCALEDLAAAVLCYEKAGVRAG